MKSYKFTKNLKNNITAGSKLKIQVVILVNANNSAHIRNYRQKTKSNDSLNLCNLADNSLQLLPNCVKSG